VASPTPSGSGDERHPIVQLAHRVSSFLT